MNAGRGLLRLWIFASAIWLISWGAYIWISRLDALEDATGQRFIAFHTGFGAGWKEPKDFAFADYLSVASVGLGLPFIVLGLGYGACWVIAGFRRRAN